MHERLRVLVRGAVQGVGFRPFVYRLATSLDLAGWVLNGPRGVEIEVEGPGPRLREFLVALEQDAPPRALVQGLEGAWLDPVPYTGFEIRESAHDGEQTALVLPDLAMCDDCRREITTPSDRRYRYPFTNCTNCGPRFTIIHALPYDRAATSMRQFVMCPACETEYHDPANRRFHAQPNACPVCGPQVVLCGADGRVVAAADDALQQAARAIRQGRIVAVKGLGGFHLMANAVDAEAVERLRARKHRDEKPFAIMCPTIEHVRAACDVSLDEWRLLCSPESPIVLLDRRTDLPADIVRAVAPGTNTLGVMLPYTPLHHVLLDDVGGPVVATSGNRTDEPICTDAREALARLGDIADLFLVHDRPIVRHVDDSIVRVVLGRELVLRRARGYAPLPVPMRPSPGAMLAVGAHLKNAVALATGSSVFISQHLGDLETPQAVRAFGRAIDDLQTLLHTAPEVVVADAHPGYVSTKHAVELGLPVVHVQHHLAHVAGCLAENDLEPPALGVAWDGTGLGADRTIWGGEFLRVGADGWSRAACLRPFWLPGGDAAAREPRRSAFGLLYTIHGPDVTTLDLPAVRSFAVADRHVLCQAIARHLNTAVTTSTGRLFDAVAALIGLRERSSFEGQAAMQLEWAAFPEVRDAYQFEIVPGTTHDAMGTWVPPPFVLDWAPTIAGLLEDLDDDRPIGEMSAKFHNTMAAMIAAVASRIGERRVLLTGGCFQNRLLIERTVAALRAAGLSPYWHQRVPPNDGGLAYGQIAAVAFGLAGQGVEFDHGEVGGRGEDCTLEVMEGHGGGTR